MLNSQAVARRGLVFLVTAVVVPIWIGTVQRPVQDMVPTKLALGLLKQPFQPADSPQPTLLVGAIPSELEGSLYIPEGATIHGSAVYPDRAVIVATAPVDSTELSEMYGREMLRLGWEVPSARGALGPETRRAISIPLVYCNTENNSVMVTVDREGIDSSDIRIDHSRDQPGAVCRPRPTVPSLGDQLGIGDISLPEASPLASGRCLGNSRTGSWIGGFSTELTGDELMGHYARPLEGSGWTPVERDTSRQSVTRAWTLNRDGREVAHAILALTPFPQRDDCWSIDLAVTGISEERRDD